MISVKAPYIATYSANYLFSNSEVLSEDQQKHRDELKAVSRKSPLATYSHFVVFGTWFPVNVLFNINTID